MNVALIEFENSHDECLYTQVAFLSKANHKVFLCCTNTLYERVKHFDGVEQFICRDFNQFKFFAFRKFAKELHALNIDLVIFNTASGDKVAKFLFFSCFYKFRYAGLIHNVNKLNTSNTQKIISRKIKKYFVLNDYIDVTNDKVACSAFYPIFFPPIKIMPIEKPENEIWLCIPGQLEYKRRAYEALFSTIAQYGLPKNIRLLFLGRCMHSEGNGAEAKQTIADLGIDKQCLLFDNFVSLDVFYAYMQASDYIFPLIHPEESETKGYGSYKVSGAFNAAFGFKKILICDEYYARYKDFEDSSIFYDPKKLYEIFEKIALTIDENLFYKNPFWNFETHQQKFLSFLNL